MDSELKTKVETALASLITDRAAGDALKLETSAPGKVGGVLVSSQFVGKSHAERQDLIWDLLDSALSKHEATRITLILAKTPEEYEAQRESA